MKFRIDTSSGFLDTSHTKIALCAREWVQHSANASGDVDVAGTFGGKFENCWPRRLPACLPLHTVVVVDVVASVAVVVVGGCCSSVWSVHKTTTEVYSWLGAGCHGGGGGVVWWWWWRWRQRQMRRRRGAGRATLALCGECVCSPLLLSLLSMQRQQRQQQASRQCFAYCLCHHTYL